MLNKGRDGKMRILIIEDDPRVSGFISKGLKEQGYTVDSAQNGRDGLFLATTEKYDAAIIDRMVPEPDGLTILRAMRASGNQTPVLILSALASVDDRVTGLRAGGDDYLVKPFAFAELLARIEILARRKPVVEAGPARLAAGDLELNLLTRKASRAGQQIELQAREYALLEYLLRHKGQVVTRTMLLENVWDYNFDPQTNVIDVHISRLRSKIDKGFSTTLLKTVRGAGYIIED